VLEVHHTTVLVEMGINTQKWLGMVMHTVAVAVAVLILAMIKLGMVHGDG
jgi:4-hydroxybenzoate polyprenyltransferase